MKIQNIRSVVLPKEFSFYSNLNKEQIEKYKYPARLNAGLFMIILKGRCDMSINLENYTITEESIVTVFPNSIIQMNNYSDEFDAYYLVMIPGYINNIGLIQLYITIEKYTIFQLKSIPVLIVCEDKKSYLNAG